MIPFAVAAVFALFRRYLPASRTVAFTVSDAKEFSRLQWVVGGVALLVGGVFGYVSYQALSGLNRFLAFDGTGARFVLLPSPWVWFFVPFFGGICLAWEITFRLWLLAGDPSKARRYESWNNMQAGFDTLRVFRLMASTILLPIFIATVLALPIHTSMDDSGLRIGHFARLGTANYAWSAVRKITVTDGLRSRDGSLSRRPAIVLDFSDGNRWSSADNRDPEKTLDVSMLDYLMKKTGLWAEHIEAFPFGGA